MEQVMELIGQADGIVQVIALAACAFLMWLDRRDKRLTDEVRQDIHTAATEVASRMGAETLAALRDGKLSKAERERFVNQATALAREFTSAHGLDIARAFAGEHSRLLSYVEAALKAK